MRERSARRAHWRPLLTVVVALAIMAAACGDDGDDESTTAQTSTEQTDNGSDTTGDSADTSTEEAAEEVAETPEAIEPGTKIRLLTHDSFSVSDGLFDSFTLETGIDVEVVKGGDAGELVSRTILTAGQPEADVLYGVDNTFLQRALDAEVFAPYTSPLLDTVPAEFRFDDQNRATPIDYGDVCVNYWTDSLDGAPPASLDDLTKPEFASTFVTQDPESSSPGFAFLLATIAAYGESGWQDYWRELVDGGVSVTAGWGDAYYGEFIAGGGDKALVTSYATSPVAALIFAETDIDEPPTGVLTDGCFRQVEFAAVLAGTSQPEAAGQLIDFMLSDEFQADIPLNMFVFPAKEGITPPQTFVDWAAHVDDPVTFSPSEIEENRSRWTQEWAEIVLR